MDGKEDQMQTAAAATPILEEPPKPLRPGEEDWESVLTPLTRKTKHGKWHRIKSFSSSGGATNAMKRLRERRTPIPAPEGQWEFTTRKRGEKGRDLYAKYQPGPK
jgi:hypothetical protein